MHRTEKWTDKINLQQDQQLIKMDNSCLYSSATVTLIALIHAQEPFHSLGKIIMMHEG